MTGIDIVEYYNQGISWQEFVAGARKNADRMAAFYEGFEFDEEDLALFNGKTPLQVLAIGEDWCPDVVQNLAMAARICDEVPGMELSIVGRDDNAALMDEYLTGGNRRIPVIVFLDSTFRELARWTGRCRKADDWILGEVTKERGWADMSEDELVAFNAEYDKRFRGEYAKLTLEEWEHLLADEDF